MQSQSIPSSTVVKEEDYKTRKARVFEGISKVIPPSTSELNNCDTVLTDIQYTRITEWCRSNNFPIWSKIPRTLVVLHIIGCPEAIEGFADEGLSDVFLPYSEENLPRVIKGSKRAEFITHQHKVLSEQAIGLERSGASHCNIDGDADLHFYLHRELGSGGFGTVDHVFSRLSLKPFARKRIPRGRSFKRDLDAIRVFENELKTLKTLSHTHLVRLISSYTDHRFVGLIMTPVADMDLQAYLIAPLVDIPDRPIRLRHFFGCLATAVEYLHRQKVRHKDIKPQNILVKEGKVLLTDFGTSRCWADEPGDTTVGTNKQAFTKAYCAPEVANHQTRNISADIWSLGCVFLEMSTVLINKTILDMRTFFKSHGTKGLYVRDNPEAAILWVDHLKGLSPDSHDHQVLDIVPEMCDFDQNNRPTATEIVSLILDFEGPMYYGFCCDRDQDHVQTADPDMTTIVSLREPASMTIIKHEADHSIEMVESRNPNLTQSEITIRLSSLGEFLRYETAQHEKGQISGQAVRSVQNTSTDNPLAQRLLEWSKREGFAPRAGIDIDGGWTEAKIMEEIISEGWLGDIDVDGLTEAEQDVLVEKIAEAYRQRYTRRLFQDGSSPIPSSREHDQVHKTTMAEPKQNFDKEQHVTVEGASDVPANSARSSTLRVGTPHTSDLSDTLDVSSPQQRTLNADFPEAATDLASENLPFRAGATIVSRKPIPSREADNIQGTAETTSIETQHQLEQDLIFSKWFEENKVYLKTREEIYGSTPLHYAAGQGCLEVVQYLAEHGADFEAKDKDQWTPLHHAVGQDRLEVIQYLAEHGADVEAKDKGQWTPLHHAARRGHLEVVQYLAEHGADVEAKDKDQWTPLHRAALLGHLEMVQWLVNQGANIDALNQSSQSPADLAGSYRHAAVANYLRAEMSSRRKPEAVSKREEKSAPKKVTLKDRIFGRKSR